MQLPLLVFYLDIKDKVVTFVARLAIFLGTLHQKDKFPIFVL